VLISFICSRFVLYAHTLSRIFLMFYMLTICSTSGVLRKIRQICCSRNQKQVLLCRKGLISCLKQPVKEVFMSKHARRQPWPPSYKCRWQIPLFCTIYGLHSKQMLHLDDTERLNATVMHCLHPKQMLFPYVSCLGKRDLTYALHCFNWQVMLLSETDLLISAHGAQMTEPRLHGQEQ
jgi:hypothetical protein